VGCTVILYPRRFRLADSLNRLSMNTTTSCNRYGVLILYSCPGLIFQHIGIARFHRPHTNSCPTLMYQVSSTLHSISPVSFRMIACGLVSVHQVSWMHYYCVIPIELLTILIGRDHSRQSSTIIRFIYRKWYAVSIFISQFALPFAYFSPIKVVFHVY
jgi:hypothetical protein